MTNPGLFFLPLSPFVTVWLLLAEHIRPHYLLIIIKSTTCPFLLRPRDYCGLQLKLAPHGSPPEMGISINFRVFSSDHCAVLPEWHCTCASHSLRTAEDRPPQPDPHPWLQHPHILARGDAPAAVCGAKELTGASLGKAGFPSEESLPGQAEAQAPRS